MPVLIISSSLSSMHRTGLPVLKQAGLSINHFLLARGIKNAQPESKQAKRQRSRASEPRKPRERSRLSVSVRRFMRIRKEISKDVTLK